MGRGEGLKKLFTFGLLLLGAAAAQAQQYVIATYAGGPPPAGADPNASNGVQRVATDASGNVYFTSGAKCVCVFKLDPNGVVTRVAGTSQRGFSGDGGPATSATLGFMAGVAVDSAGSLFIAEAYYSYRVRKVSPGGIITTVAGNGTPGFSGDGGPATSAQLGEYLNGVEVDGAGNLFIAEGAYYDGCGGAAFGNNRIRKVTPDGIITTVVGDGTFGFSGDGGPATSAQLSGPRDMAVDSGGNLFFADGSRIRKVSPDGIIRTVVDPDTLIPECLAAQAFCYTSSVTLDPAGNLFFSEGGGYGALFGLFKLSPGGVITTVVGRDAPVGAGFGFSMAVDGAGNLFLADGSTLRKVSPDGLITTLAGSGACCYSGDGGPAGSAQLNHTSSVAADRAGNLFIADTDNHRIRRVSPNGIISTVAGNGTWSLGCPALSGDSGPATDAQLCRPSRVAVGAGNLFIVDGYRVRKVSPDGTIAPVAGNGTCCYSGDDGPATDAQLSPVAVAADGAGNLFISDQTDRVRKVSPDGIITTVAGNGTRGFSGDGGLATDAQLAHAIDLAVDSAGNLYIADQVNHRIRKVSQDGIITTAAGSGSPFDSRTPSGDGGPATNAPLFPPNGVAVDGAGNLFISDPFRIRKVSPGGIITTVAGAFFMPGYSGDAGPATSARFWNATGVAADGAGNVYVADTFNNVVRILRPIR